MMAEKRMFAKSVITSDTFLDMSHSARNLYFFLSMFADDEGFVCNPKAIIRQCGCKPKDLEDLIKTCFIFRFDSGVIVIRHWKVNNNLQKDRCKETVCLAEKATLTENSCGVYEMAEASASKLDTIRIQDVSKMENECAPFGNNLDTQESLNKDIITNNRVVEGSEEPKEESATSPPKGGTHINDLKHKYGEYRNVLLTDDELEKLKTEFPTDWKQRIERLSEYMASLGKSYKNHYATICSWYRKEEKNKAAPPTNTTHPKVKYQPETINDANKWNDPGLWAWQGAAWARAEKKRSTKNDSS